MTYDGIDTVVAESIAGHADQQPVRGLRHMYLSLCSNILSALISKPPFNDESWMHL
jgi:hypothetical protein